MSNTGDLQEQRNNIYRNISWSYQADSRITAADKYTGKATGNIKTGNV
jgi:hypothetical protein